MNSWPQDYSDAVFLGRAADEIGTAMFGPDWLGNEFRMGLHLPLRVPPAGVAGMSTLDLHRVHVLLHLHRPDRGLPRPPETPVTRAPPPTPTVASMRGGRPPQAAAVSPADERVTPAFALTADDVSEASRLIIELNEGNREALARRQAVCEEIVRGCEAGELAGCYLDAATGRLRSTPAEWWRSPNVGDRFENWKVDFKSPFKRLYYVSESVSWLFVGRDSLAAFIRPMPFNKRTMADLKTATVAAELAQRLMNEPQWELAETLLWIGLREIQEVASPLAYWRDNPEKQSGQLVAMANIYLSAHAAEGNVVHTANPHDWLQASLRCGDVVASGLSRGASGRSNIPPSDWYDIGLIDGPAAVAGQQAGAFMQGPTPTVGQFWTRLRFPRADIVRAYPPSDSARLKGPTEPPSHPGPTQGADADIKFALAAMKAQSKPLARYTLAAFIVDNRWPGGRGAIRKKRVASLRRWPAGRWDEIVIMAQELGLTIK